ncbi:MAG: hypothetical protein AB8B72_11845 [Crocinitomicaceae bacterium]
MKLTLLCTILTISVLGFSQVNSKVRQFKNSFRIYALAFSNFDERQILHQPFKYGGSMPIGIGGIFSRQLKSGNFIDFDLSQGSYMNPFPYDFFENGTVDRRSVTSFIMSYKRNVFANTNGSLHYLIGGSFRVGREVLHDNYSNPGFWQCIVLQNQLFDLGSNFGLEYQLNIGSHLSINSLLSYTFYPLTVDFRDVYIGDKGSARHALQFKLGIGYQYGKSNAASKLELEENKYVGRKHQLTIYKSIYQFFDGSPMIQNKGQYSQRGPNIAGSYGVSYQNKINNNWFWLVGLEDFEFRNSIPRYSAPNGTISNRNFGLLNLNLLRLISEKDQFAAYAKLGLNFRYGFEYSVGERVPISNTNKTLQKDYRDMGINSGIKVEWFSNNFVHLSTVVNYTYLPLTYSEKDPSYFWDKGPNKHMLSISLGIGISR